MRAVERPEDVVIRDAYDDTIMVYPSDDGMTVVVEITEFTATGSTTTSVSLTPEKALRLSLAARNAQMYVEEGYTS